MSSSLSFLQNTRDGTIIPSRALLLLVACYHDQNHTHYLVEVIEVVVGGRSRWMSWRRRRWPLPPTCSRYSVCRHYCPHSRRSGLAVCHPVVYCRHPAKRDHFGCEFIGNNMKKKQFPNKIYALTNLIFSRWCLSRQKWWSTNARNQNVQDTGNCSTNLVSGQLPGDGQEYFINVVCVLR